ncbi:MAG: hypothetical protein MUE51_12855 [Thermoleophilia bacterium]|jgi:hypothetical protein|nr:hypothetical protein [Thermoleophilia bacterium]
MGWLSEHWDLAALLAAGVGALAGVVLVVFGVSGLGEVAGALIAASVLWARWQIPPPGRSKAAGAPSDAWGRVGRVVVAVLIVVLVADVATRAVTVG